jgi:cytochrome P450/NADPH-cytochrome P450 reductase
MQVKSGRKDVGRILLFFGCRYPDKDYLYSDSDLKEWVELGVVDIRPAFSRATDQSEGCRYIQDRILKDGEDVKAFYRQNAKVSILVMAIRTMLMIDFAVLHLRRHCCI